MTMMKMYEGFLPTNPNPNKTGYYPVCNSQEWDDLPAVYKAMEWKSVAVYNRVIGRKEATVAKYIEFDVSYLAPYKVMAVVRVPIDDVQQILFCHHEKTQCHLYSICGVVFANGERASAEWRQDSATGAFAVYSCGQMIGVQGGYLGYVPSIIDKTDDGFKYNGHYNEINRVHYCFSNPF